MPRAWGAVLLIQLALGGVASAEPIERYERYSVVRVAEGLEIRSPSPRIASRVFSLLGVALMTCALVLRVRGSDGLVPVSLGAVGAIALIAGGIAMLDHSKWRVSEVGVDHQGFAGRTQHWRTDEITRVDVVERRPTGPELKRGVRRVFEVGLWGSSGERLTHFHFRQQS